jgi:hypothetical protein
MSAFPPLHTRPSRPVDTETALSLLQDYLSRASSANAPHLLPNAILTATGPTAQSAESNLTIHNLKRVEAGLRGEWLAPSLDLDGGVDAGYQAGYDGKAATNGGTSGQTEEEGWQDLGEYQREQEVLEGDVGDSDGGVGQEGDEMAEEMADVRPTKDDDEIIEKTVHIQPESSARQQKIDKEARKAEKKARHKASLQQKGAVQRNG